MRLIVPQNQPPIPLRAYLARALPGVPAGALRRMLAGRQVKRNGERLDAGSLVRGGDALTVYLPKGLAREPADGAAAQAAAGGPEIPTVYEDGRIWLVSKPRGIASRGADDPRGEPGVLEYLQRRLEARGEGGPLALCHRLDHQTGGLLLLAKDAASEAALREAFARREVEKLYTCLTVGTPEPEQAELRAYLRKDARAARVTVRGIPFAGAAPIRTAYRVLHSGPVARVEVRLITGRTHQIRAHLAHIGHPVLGDDKYGDRAANRAHGARVQRLWATGLTLHGAALGGLDGRSFHIEAPF
ncbi:MAG: RluA family pseudouridine synthase [Clostridia bacterium]|nr:RluA family pseudouridine synthase [Clostridia bacterium]